jgi:lipoprotein signal peptidase
MNAEVVHVRTVELALIMSISIIVIVHQAMKALIVKRVRNEQEKQLNITPFFNILETLSFA